MKPLYTEEEFKNAKSKDYLLCECLFCKKYFNTIKHNIVNSFNPNSRANIDFCSIKCAKASLSKKIEVKCVNCHSLFLKGNADVKRSNNHFCSKSCSATYNNKNKTTGNRRSKLEIWLEEQLTQLYPDLPIDFNKKDAIGSELDIYIPSLNLAFELNGIFHYEPIYWTNKLDQIQSNDKSKSLACHEAKIDLCIIDTSAQKYVKPSTSQKYSDIINNIIKERLLIS